MTEAAKRPRTDLMRQCAEGHRTIANTYAMDLDEDAQVTAQGSLMTALLLEAAATFIDAVPVPEPETVADATPS